MCKFEGDIIQHTTSILDPALSKGEEGSEDRVWSRTYYIPSTFTKWKPKTKMSNICTTVAPLKGEVCDGRMKWLCSKSPICHFSCLI